MSVTRITRMVNIGGLIVMLILAGVITLYTDWATDSRDDSAVTWEDSCLVSDVIRENGAVELWCRSSHGEVVLASADSPYIALIGNTPISERAKVPATCRNYQSGRWTCQVGNENEFYKFRDVTTHDEE